MTVQKENAPGQTTDRTGYWDCDCGRECRHKDGAERLPDCRAEWVPLVVKDSLTTQPPACGRTVRLPYINRAMKTG